MVSVVERKRILLRGRRGLHPDRFNLTGLNNEVSNYPQALDVITDNFGASLLCRVFRIVFLGDADDEIQDDLRGSLDVQARLLYGLIHARWIVTARGLAKWCGLHLGPMRRIFYSPTYAHTARKI
jgi:hypothetical protein